MDQTHPFRTLELTVLSAEDLRVDRKPATRNLYVVVRADSIKSYTTSLAVEGNCPSWNQKFLVDMPLHARSITFEVKCKTSTRVKDVGLARIAVSDFIGGVVPDHCLQFLSYRLRDSEGQRNGVINFSVKVNSPEHVSSSVTKPVMERTGSCGFQMGGALGTSSSPGGIVTGIPVSWNNYARNV